MSDTHISAELETQPEDVRLPTSSLISVRLSAYMANKEASPPRTPRESPRISVASSGSSTPTSSSDSGSFSPVDWEGLEKTEEQEPRDEGTDEVCPMYDVSICCSQSQSTALLLARLEKENAALATDPKSSITHPRRLRSDTRPPSIQHLKKLVNGPQRQSIRYSLLPAPQMTELEFWAALVQDYPQTVERLPTLTSNKIRGGVPPPLRGVVWPAIAGAHDSHLHAEFQRLSNQLSPYDGLIGKDVGRSFPNVELFREKDGEGQTMLRNVLKAFSLYDTAIGYCQGLGFVVGPLLMHMSEAEAFAILVRLMEHYDLRSCYLPDLSGLHLRIHQFQTLLTRHLPHLSAHLAQLKVEPLYVSQWFLSFFAVTCPLPMLLRIYDVILSEGATETLMRVALSLMQRNEQKLLAFSEFEDVMQFLLSRSLWDVYAQHADAMVLDFVSLTSLVTQESLQTLETSFEQTQNLPAMGSLKSTAANLLGRFWAGASHTPSKSANLSLTIPSSTISLRKSSSGQSITSTLDSFTTSASGTSTTATELSDDIATKSARSSTVNESSAVSIQAKDRDLHQQIEELLTAMNHLQHQQAEASRDLQREREERAEDQLIARQLLSRLQEQNQMIQELAGEDDLGADELLEKAGSRLGSAGDQRNSIIQSKHQLRDTADDWRAKHEAEATRCQDLMKQLDEREAECNTVKEQLRDARTRVQDSHRDKQRLERQVQELRSQQSYTPESPSDLYTPTTPSADFADLKPLPPKPGLREFKLGRPELPRTSSMAAFSKRSSSLNAAAMLQQVAETQQSPDQDALLLELVNAKTGEAVAKQELEETKNKLDSLRKILSGAATSPITRVPSRGSPLGTSPSSANAVTSRDIQPVQASSASTGGFFSGWGRRNG